MRNPDFSVSSRSMKSIALTLLFLLPLLSMQAQSLKILSQQKMKRWQVPPANYSGITPLGGDLYAVCDDKAKNDGYYLFRIATDSVKGRVKSMEIIQQPLTKPEQKSAHDAEGICYVPDTRTLFVSSEDDQRIREYDMQGKATGRELLIPKAFAKDSIRANMGFEALCFDTLRHLFVTTSEAPLLHDEATGIDRLQTFDLSLHPREQFLYKMDAPELTGNSRQHIQGIAAITATSDGSWLILEREINIKSKYIGSKAVTKIYRVRPNIQEQPLNKELVCRFTSRIAPLAKRFANYEGMCLGPKLQNGQQTLLLLSDSQAGAGNSLYRLQDYLRVVILP